MTKDWRLLAEAAGFEIPAECLDRLAPRLEALEAAFRPLAAELAPEAEPALVFPSTRESAR